MGDQERMVRYKAFLELMEAKYTGPNLTTAQLCMDKYAFYSRHESKQPTGFRQI